MKILYYNLELGSYDGSNMHALGMLEALKKECGENNIFVPSDFTQTKYNHESSILKKKFSKILKPIRKFRRDLISNKNTAKILSNIAHANFQPDYILARSVLYDTTPILLAEKLGCKLIIEHNTPLVYETCYLRNIDTERNVKKFELKLLDSADGIYVVSDVLKEMLLLEYKEIRNEKINVTPNGFMKDLYNIPDEEKSITRNKIRKKMNVENKWVVVFIGSLQSWHGIEKLISVARDMSEEKDIEFWVLGDGEKRKIVKDYSEEYDNLKWFGNVPFEKMRDLLFSSDLGIMPYENIDNFYFSPLKMFDMIGANIPFIGLKTGQIETISNLYLSNDFLINTNSTEEIVSKINQIKNDQKCYDSMKKLIINTSGTHTWDKRAKLLCDWMRSI